MQTIYFSISSGISFLYPKRIEASFALLHHALRVLKRFLFADETSLAKAKA